MSIGSDVLTMAASPEPGRRPRASVPGSFVLGWRRALGAPWVAGGVLAAIALFAPRFGANAQGLVGRFTEILGFGSSLAIVSHLLDGNARSAVIAGAVAAYIALWTFLWGGILDRLARGRRVGAGAFFSACGGYGLRFLRLELVIGAAYWALFHWLRPVLLTSLYDRWTRDLTVEREAVAIRAGLYAVFLAAALSVSLVADIARVRAVVEDRRSMLGALAASIRFIRRRLWRMLGLYLLNIVALGALVVVWPLVAPSAATAPWRALLVTELYLLVGVWARLGFMASEAVFFQGELAHAHYTAAPLPTWPDSPAAEAIENLARQGHGGRGAEHGGTARNWENPGTS